MFCSDAPSDDMDVDLEDKISNEHHDNVQVATGSVPDRPKLSSFVPTDPPETPTTVSIQNFLSDYSYNITKEQLAMSLNELYNRWSQYSLDHSGYSTVCAYKLFNLDPDSDKLNVADLAKRESDVKNLCFHLYNRMVTEKLIDADNTSDSMGKQLTMIAHLISRNADAVRSHFHLIETNTENYSTANSNSITFWNMRMGAGLAGDDDAVASLSAGQRFILNVLKMAHDNNFRKHQGHLFKQVIDNGNRTHAWTVHCSIEDFLYECANKNEDFGMWKDFTAGARIPVFATEYISKSTRDLELSSLNPDRNIFSFSNGVYDAFNGQMYLYSDGHIPERFVAAKYFDVPMPTDDYDSFRDIPTPALDGILLHQKIPTDLEIPSKYANTPDLGDDAKFSVMDWIYVFMGRMIYEIGEHDTWQSLMFLKGKAGTGKSTLGKVLSFLYDAVDVGVLSNNIEQKFGLSGLVDKLIYICFEVKRDFKLDQGEMQSMISGEPIGIATKGKDPRSVTWKTHGFFMGNEFPRWTNNSGSIARRIITVLFDEMVTDGDPRLFEKLQAEMGNIIVKINRAYRQCASLYGGDDIWNLLPPYFKEIREKQLEAATNHINAYLVYLKYDDNGKTYRYDPDGTIEYLPFKHTAIEWISQNLGVTKINWKRDIDGLYQKFGLTHDGSFIGGLSDGTGMV